MERPNKKWCKSEIKYVRGLKGLPVCENCDAYQEGSCALVKGEISGSSGSCNFYRSRGIKIQRPNAPVLEKHEARYQDIEGGSTCGKCKFYEGNNDCSVVFGNVHPNSGRCLAFKGKYYYEKTQKRLETLEKRHQGIQERNQ